MADDFGAAARATIGDDGAAFAALVREVAQAYAEQTEADHAALCAAVGR